MTASPCLGSPQSHLWLSAHQPLQPDHRNLQHVRQCNQRPECKRATSHLVSMRDHLVRHHHINNYLSMYTACTSWDLEWNLSIMALRTKDTSIIQTAIDGLKRSAIETCTYLTSELRTPLYSVLRTHDPVPNGHNAQLINSIIRSGPCP